jgi:hypothetical protein
LNDRLWNKKSCSFVSTVAFLCNARVTSPE